jgi:hypothetical protein
MDNIIKVKPTKKNSASVARLEGLSRRLMFKLHIKRTKLLESDRDNNEETELTLRKGGRGEPSGDCPRIHYNKL